MKRKKRVVICTIICVIVAAIGIAILFLIYKKNNKVTNSELNNVSTENKVSSDEQNLISKEDANLAKSILEDILATGKIKEGIVLKSTNSDVTSEKLTEEEYNLKKEENIIKVIENKELLKIYTEGNSKYVEYMPEEVLNKLGYSTHMNTGFGYGFRTINLSNNGEISNRMIIQKVLDNIFSTGKIGDGYVLKSTTGDITAEKLSEKEFLESENSYVDVLEKNIDLFKIYSENNSKYVEYMPEEILNKLGYSTHMNVGFGFNFNTINLSESNVASNRMIIQKVLDEISQKDFSNDLLKSTTGDITAEKLTQKEFIENENSYVGLLEKETKLFNIYTTNGKQYVEYTVEEVLNKLGLSSHMGVGIRQGVQKLEIV